MKSIWILLLPFAFLLGQSEHHIEIGTFNIEWFPCKDDGEMMKRYGIELRWQPEGEPTDIKALFKELKSLDVELMGVQEIVDPKMLEDSAKVYLGPEFEVIYSPYGGSQKVGFLYDSSVLSVEGSPETYTDVTLGPDSRLRPAFRAFFRYKPNGFDFHAVVVHLKASPRGWDQRKQQWEIMEKILRTLPEESKDGDIVLLGDFNNVTDQGTGEFDEIMNRLGFWRATVEVDTLASNFWQPDYTVERIQASLIDHIFLSADARIEYVENTMRVGGMCAEGESEYKGEQIPHFYERVSDHCPVFGSFRADVDED
jgi:endonuclease/exonuclease/phosphatase family metal-dependent hydrolase